MESILQHLGFPLAVIVVVIGIAIARRIGSDDAIEIGALRKQNSKLEAELRKYQELEIRGSK